MEAEACERVELLTTVIALVTHGQLLRAIGRGGLIFCCERLSSSFDRSFGYHCGAAHIVLVILRRGGLSFVVSFDCGFVTGYSSVPSDEISNRGPVFGFPTKMVRLTSTIFSGVSLICVFR